MKSKFLAFALLGASCAAAFAGTGGGASCQPPPPTFTVKVHIQTCCRGCWKDCECLTCPDVDTAWLATYLNDDGSKVLYSAVITTDAQNACYYQWLQSVSCCPLYRVNYEFDCQNVPAPAATIPGNLFGSAAITDVLSYESTCPSVTLEGVTNIYAVGGNPGQHRHWTRGHCGWGYGLYPTKWVQGGSHVQIQLVGSGIGFPDQQPGAALAF